MTLQNQDSVPELGVHRSVRVPASPVLGPAGRQSDPGQAGGPVINSSVAHPSRFRGRWGEVVQVPERLDGADVAGNLARARLVRRKAQRNVIKAGIPVVGVPIAVVLNRYTTLLAGRHAQAVFRNEARVIELAEGLSKRSQHPQLMLWVAWLVIMADHKIADDEALLIRHLVRLARDQHQVVDRQLAHLVDIDPAEVWRRLDDEPGDLSDILDAASRVATVDGPVSTLEKAVISELRDRCRRA